MLRDLRRIKSRASADKFSDTHEAFAKIRSARGSHLFEDVFHWKNQLELMYSIRAELYFEMSTTLPPW